jgi:hypothetical protein
MPNPRNAKESCSNCRFFDAGPKKPESRCKRNPPTPILENGKIVSAFPPVLETGWCGEWKA